MKSVIIYHLNFFPKRSIHPRKTLVIVWPALTRVRNALLDPKVSFCKMFQLGLKRVGSEAQIRYKTFLLSHITQSKLALSRPFSTITILDKYRLVRTAAPRLIRSKAKSRTRLRPYRRSSSSAGPLPMKPLISLRKAPRVSGSRPNCTPIQGKSTTLVQRLVSTSRSLLVQMHREAAPVLIIAISMSSHLRLPTRFSLKEKEWRWIKLGTRTPSTISATLSRQGLPNVSNRSTTR